MQTQQAAVNGISVTYEDKGPKDAPVILLVMGLGAQLLADLADLDVLSEEELLNRRYQRLMSYGYA